MTTENIDRLFLELSQFTQATTAKEIALRTALDALLAAALKASPILGHIYHTTPMPHEMEEDAHEGYQALDAAIDAAQALIGATK